MPHSRPLSRVLTLSLAPALALAPCRAALAERTGPGPAQDDGPVMMWPVDSEDEGVEDVEAAVEEAGHRVVPFAPVAIELRKGRAARLEAMQAELTRVDAALASAQEHYLA